MPRFYRWNNTKDARPDPAAVWLQTVGWVKGCNATEVKPGMFMLYNMGTHAEVVEVKPTGRQSVYVTVKVTEDSYGKPLAEPKYYTSLRRGLVPAQFPADR